VRNYNLRLSEYNISRELYNELRYRCLRYPQMLAELEEIREGFNSVQEPMSVERRAPGDPTAKRAIKAIKLADTVREIEKAAVDADPRLYAYILANVTRKATFEDLHPPCGRRQFFEARRKFYRNLADNVNIL
jgi:hypothetical protein